MVILPNDNGDHNTSAECRICFEEGVPRKIGTPDIYDLIAPCNCTGTMQWVHLICLKRARQVKPADNTKCPVCLSIYTFFKTSGYTDIPNMIHQICNSKHAYAIAPGNMYAVHIINTVAFIQLFTYVFNVQRYILASYISSKIILFAIDVRKFIYFSSLIRYNRIQYFKHALHAGTLLMCICIGIDIFLDYILVKNTRYSMFDIMPLAYIITNVVRPIMIPIMFVFHTETVRRLNQAIERVWD